MKKSHLGDIFSEDSSSSDKSLLTYHQPRQHEVGMASASPPSPPANLPSSSTCSTAGAPSVVKEKHRESPSPATGRGASPAGSIPSTTDAGGAPELLHSCIVSAFTFSGSQSVPLGSLGCALYWEPSRRRSILILYRSRQHQVGLLTLTPTSLPAIQPRHYVSLHCDAGKQFSVHLASEVTLKEFAMKIVLAAALASAETGGHPTVALALPVEDESSLSGGRRARSGDSLHLQVTGWAVQSPRSESLRQQGGTKSETIATDSSWGTALRGARPGQRWLVCDTGSLGLVRELLVTAVRPQPRQAPLHLPADNGPGWLLGDDGASSSPSSAPPSPPSSPSLPAIDTAKTVTNSRVINEEEPDTRDVEDDEKSTSSKGRRDVLARMARLGQQMFPSASGAGRPGRSPSPPPPLPSSPVRRSSTPSDPQASSSTAATSAGTATASAVATTTASTAEKAEPIAVGSEVSGGSKSATASHGAPSRLPSTPRPPIAPRPDSIELGVLFGRLEAKLEAVLSRLELPPGADADAETLAMGVRRLAVENAALRESSRKADRVAELRLEAERARAAMTTELADSLAELTETKRALAETQRRLTAAEEAADKTATAARRREEELETQLAAAKSEAETAAEAAATAAKNSAEASTESRVTKESRKLLKGLYKTLRSRLPAEGTFTGAEVAEMVAEVVRETLQRLETETGLERAETGPRAAGETQRGLGLGGIPQFVTQDECIERGDE